MPRLLSINSYHYRRGGADVVYLEHAEMFERAGWETSYFSMHHPRNEECRDSDYFADLVDWEYVGGAISKARAALGSVYNFDARSKLRKLIADRRPDIAHAHLVYHHLTPAIFPVLFEAGIPVIYTAHDLKLACPAYKMMNRDGICEKCKSGSLWNVVSNRCIKNSLSASLVVGVEAQLHALLNSYRKHLARITTPSKFYRDKLIEWGWSPEKIVYIPNFATPSEPRFREGYEGNILYFGRLSEEKGLETLVRAAALSGVPVDVAGTGPMQRQLEELIAALNAPVSLLGRLDGDALWARVGRARAVVLPSEWYENAPMSALEAMQLARPMIGADIGGIPELVTDSGAGITFPSADIDALAGALSDMAAMPAVHLAQLGERGAEYVDREFSRTLYLERMQSLYDQCRQEK